MARHLLADSRPSVSIIAPLLSAPKGILTVTMSSNLPARVRELDCQSFLPTPSKDTTAEQIRRQASSVEYFGVTKRRKKPGEPQVLRETGAAALNRECPKRTSFQNRRDVSPEGQPAWRTNYGNCDQ